MTSSRELCYDKDTLDAFVLEECKKNIKNPINLCV